MVPEFVESEFPNLSEENKKDLKRWITLINQIIRDSEIIDEYYLYSFREIADLFSEEKEINFALTFDEMDRGSSVILDGTVFILEICLSEGMTSVLGLEFNSNNNVESYIQSGDKDYEWSVLQTRIKKIVKGVTFEDGECVTMEWAGAVELITMLSTFDVPLPPKLWLS